MTAATFSQVESLGAPVRLSLFLHTAAAMRNSTFCLVPTGITATSRRFFEALEAECIPVS